MTLQGYGHELKTGWLCKTRDVHTQVKAAVVVLLWNLLCYVYVCIQFLYVVFCGGIQTSSILLNCLHENLSVHTLMLTRIYNVTMLQCVHKKMCLDCRNTIITNDSWPQMPQETRWHSSGSMYYMLCEEHVYAISYHHWPTLATLEQIIKEYEMGLKYCQHI